MKQNTPPKWALYKNGAVVHKHVDELKGIDWTTINGHITDAMVYGTGISPDANGNFTLNPYYNIFTESVVLGAEHGVIQSNNHNQYIMTENGPIPRFISYCDANQLRGNRIVIPHGYGLYDMPQHAGYELRPRPPEPAPTPRPSFLTRIRNFFS